MIPLETIAVGMSGGVDSSVTAALLIEQGRRVIGVTMKLWSGSAAPDGPAVRGACYGPGEAGDIALASETARDLGIPFHIVDLHDAYEHEVLDFVRREYACGRTPNPCVRCNPVIKFGGLVEAARRAGLEFSHFATGHYARVEFDEALGRWTLQKGADPLKDQSYFLSGLSQEQLARALFPLGGMSKARVREKARELGLKAHNRPESQDFIEGDIGGMLHLPSSPGPIIDSAGRKVGEHKGIAFYTVGQRKGLGLAASEPQYVVSIDPSRNALVAGPRAALFSSGLTACDVNWVSIAGLSHPLRAGVRIRSTHREASALLEPAGGGCVRVRFDEPQSAVAPGQAAVFYDGDLVLGGGIIEKSLDGPKGIE